MKALGRSCGVMDVLILRARWELEIKTKKEHLLEGKASVQTPAKDCHGHLRMGQQPADRHCRT